MFVFFVLGLKIPWEMGLRIRKSATTGDSEIRNNEYWSGSINDVSKKFVSLHLFLELRNA